MKNYSFLFMIFLTFFVGKELKGQNGDDCFEPIVISNPTSYCSGNDAFTTIGKTNSNYEAATCFSGTSNDIWFSFITQATEITIQLKGNTTIEPGGSLIAPEVQLYFGNCGDVLSATQACGNDSDGDNLVEVSQSGLIPGKEYFIRVQSGGSDGSFRLCLRNYNAPVNPGSDCVTASLLCDKSSFSVQKVEGAGNDLTELDAAECFNNGFPGLNNESNSTWFKWTADQSGSLTFAITPLNEIDDLDFVLYELPNGNDNCSGKIVLRCMAAGEDPSLYPSDCHGPTGLRAESDDESEPAGCSAGQDNWLSPVQIEPGKSYALVVNNFSGSGSGFEISFGGSSTFAGPEPDFEINTTANCYDEPIQFMDNSSASIGRIVKYEWFFGRGAEPATAEGQGPFTVQYDRAGKKNVLLRVTSDRGCVTTVTKQLELECCDPGIFADAGNDVQLELGESFDLMGDAFLPGQELNVQWQPSGNIACPTCLITTATPTMQGYYVLKVTDENGCSASDSLFVELILNYPAYIPNAFTPDGDDINDFFTAYSSEAAANMNLRIYDRWGGLLFDGRQLPPGVESAGWDGRFRGQDMSTGIYVYRIELQFIDGTIRNFSGDIYLQR